MVETLRAFTRKIPIRVFRLRLSSVSETGGRVAQPARDRKPGESQVLNVRT